MPCRCCALPPTPAAGAREAMRGHAVNVISAEMHIEFVAAGVNKASALRRVSDLLGEPLGAFVGFGDNMNDIEMLEAVGRGVAMANAREACKRAADTVCPYTNEEDGVSRYCEQLIADGQL